MNIPVFDLHCDTALALLGETHNEAGSLKKNELHIDLERASQLEAYCQCFACLFFFRLPASLQVSPSRARAVSQCRSKTGIFIERHPPNG